MKFTGERFIPTEGGDIRQEHMHRYAWCRHLAIGRRVLDIACGEGYGSAMLAGVAESVVGVDIAGEAVDHARKAYGALSGLEFHVGDAAEIPLGDNAFDLVVSFETIEHHDRHREMISEIRRVLQPNGLLVISSPNRIVYSERAGYHNEFHVKELDFGEFDTVLREQFSDIRYFAQRLAVGSDIFPLDPRDGLVSELTGFTDTGDEIIERASLLRDPVYYIAVASASSDLLPDSLGPSVLFSESEDLYTHHIEVAGWARKTNSELLELRDKFAEVVQNAENVSAWAHTQSKLAQDAQVQLERVQTELTEARGEIARMRGEITRMRGDLVEARGEIVRSHARLRVLEQQRAELELIKASRSWRWTKPWRFFMRMLHERGVGELDRQRLRQLFARRMSTPPGGAPRVLGVPFTDTIHGTAEGKTEARSVVRVEPAPQLEGHRDYFVWSVIDWHFRTQRPQHLARELAVAGHRVFYISNNFVDASNPGFAVEPLDAEGKLFQIHMHLNGAPQIYHAVPDAREREQLRASLGTLLKWTGTHGCVSLVQHPYWLECARILPDTRLAYDCMDHHGGFSDNDAEVLEREDELMREAELLVVTSDWLYEQTAKYDRQRLMVRNACQYEHFAHRCIEPFKDPQGRKVIGYYGAIAEWFDLDLVEKIATRFSDCLILLIGLDTTGAQVRLGHLSNVEFTGEIPYPALPAYLDGFDVCMLPFQVIPLTLATNPVKVYEYLSAGKNVVSVSLPEIRQFGDLVRVAADHEGFIEAVAEALHALPPDSSLSERRQRFAAQQTWAHRVLALTEGIDGLRGPKVSIIVVTYNNLDLTRICLASLDQLSHYDNMEVIVVDNASADGTPDFLRDWAQDRIGRKIILNSDNLGFAAGNNLGLAEAGGEYLVMLNNDTHVTPGWIATLMAHLRWDEKLGMVGPVTNNIGNEARIDIHYDDMDGMLKAAADYTSLHVGQVTPLRTAAFFCVMMRRAVYEKVGALDEAFGIGFFEDDDYCRRVERAGWTIACAEDVFIHHHLSASFNKMKQEKRQAIFEQNKAIYEAKWGAWVPHKYRGLN